MPGRMRSRNSTTVTSAPRRRQTEPSSSPITPAPTTISFLGTLGRLSAPVEETTSFSSISTPGSFATSEPVAITIAFVSSSFSLPSSPLTTTLPGERMLPSPVKDVDLVLLEEVGDAVDVGGDGVVLVLHHRGVVELWRADHDAERRHAMVSFLEHFRGVQQRLRGNAADVEARAAERLALLDHGHLQPKLGRADGAHVAAGSGADDDEIVGHSNSLYCFTVSRRRHTPQNHATRRPSIMRRARSDTPQTSERTQTTLNR